MKIRSWLLFSLTTFWLGDLAFLVRGADSTFAVRGATVHTVSGETLFPAAVLVQDGKIIGLGPDAGADGPGVDATGLHLYPGLIAASSSLGLVEIAAVRATRDFTEVGEFTPDVEAWTAVNPDSELIPVARANGITHALIVPGGGTVAGQSGLIQLSGWTVEDMVIRKPAALHVTWPRMGLDTRPRDAFRDKSQWKSLADQATERRAKLRALNDFFDDATAYARTRATAAENQESSVNPPWEGMLPWVRGEVPVMVHADDVRAIKAAVAFGADRKCRVIIAGGRDAWQVATLLATAAIPVIYEATFSLDRTADGGSATRDSAAYDISFRAPEILRRAGVKVIFSEGTGGEGAAHLRNLPYAAAQALAFGLPAAEALKGITLYPAEILGVGDRLGSLAVGKEATFIATDGDILDVRTRVKRMWIAGKEVNLETRHTRLYEKYKSRPQVPSSPRNPP